MAKRRRRRAAAAGRTEQFAEDLGRLLGTATARAESWLSQRKEVATRLTRIRDTASQLLTALGQTGQETLRRVAAGAAAVPPKRRKLSRKARKAISDAQKKRWAAQRVAGKKKTPGN